MFLLAIVDYGLIALFFVGTASLLLVVTRTAPAQEEAVTSQVPQQEKPALASYLLLGALLLLFIGLAVLEQRQNQPSRRGLLIVVAKPERTMSLQKGENKQASPIQRSESYCAAALVFFSLAIFFLSVVAFSFNPLSLLGGVAIGIGVFLMLCCIVCFILYNHYLKEEEEHL